jgi:hypothetical protein
MTRLKHALIATGVVWRARGLPQQEIDARVEAVGHVRYHLVACRGDRHPPAEALVLETVEEVAACPCARDIADLDDWAARVWAATRAMVDLGLRRRVHGGGVTAPTLQAAARVGACRRWIEVPYVVAA